MVSHGWRIIFLGSRSPLFLVHKSFLSFIYSHNADPSLDEQNLPYRLTNSAVLDHAAQARGWSISVCPVPKHHLTPQPKTASPLETEEATSQSITNTVATTSQMAFQDASVRRRIVNGCNKLIESEPTITEYDTIVGDAGRSFQHHQL